MEKDKVFNKGVKSVENKIKEKIEDLDLECEKCRFSGQICEEFLTNNQCTIIKCKTILNQLLEEEK